MVSDLKQHFIRELGHLLSELKTCTDFHVKTVICEHILLISLALVSISD
ncbi:hypothetical protein LIS77_06545 [Cytobacillus firmus]|nr:hypothetical protein [Cytobacillus firmus]USK40156.1 hypothetical protein LIS77_06545 [Cytobacillus firmus]